MRFGIKAAHARNLGSIVTRVLYRTTVSGAHHVPHDQGCLIVAATKDPLALQVIKSLSPRPLVALMPREVASLAGDLPIIEPYAIDAQLTAAEWISKGGAVLLGRDSVDPGFLAMKSIPVVPVVSVHIDSTGRVHPWDVRTPRFRAETVVYFGEPSNWASPMPDNDVHVPLSKLASFASEWVRQQLVDHESHVWQRLGSVTRKV